MLVTCSQDQGDVVNSEDLETRVVAHLVDQHHNQCGMLPAGIDLLSSPPQLTVQHGQLEGPSVWTKFKVADADGRYAGRWVFQNGVLSMPDLALLGSPGTVRLTLSGGTRDSGRCVTDNTLSLQLHPGSVAQICVDGWPPHPGTVCYCCRFQLCHFQGCCLQSHIRLLSSMSAWCNGLHFMAGAEMYRGHNSITPMTRSVT